MMKKKSIISVLLFCIGMFSFISTGQAFFFDKILAMPAPALITPDLVEPGVTGVKTAGSTVQGVMRAKNQIQNEVNNIRSAINSIFNFSFEGALQGNLNIGLRGAKGCQIEKLPVDIYNSDDVANAVYWIALKEPYIEMRDAFWEKRERFIEANILDIMSATDNMKVYMETVVRPSMEKLKEAVKEGGHGLPAPDGGSEAVENEGKAVETIENLLKLLERTIALKAQLQGILAIKNDIDTIEYQNGDEQKIKKGEKQASLFIEVEGNSKKYAQSVPLAFARLSSEKVTETMTSAEISGLSAATRRELSFMGASIKYTLAPESEISHPYYDNADKIDELNKLKPIHDEIEEAISAHNMINNLPEYKEAAIGYQKIVERHKKAIETLKLSQQCVQQYLARRYNNAPSVFNGGVSDVTAYDKMKGIGGWAIEAFETAKATQATTDTIGDEAQVGYEYDPNVTVTADMGISNTYADEINQKNALTGSPQKQEKSLKESRETFLIPWEVGAEASKMLAATPEKWGDVKQKFPVWTDTKSFYNQYLNGKYDNIEKLLKSYSVSDVKALIVAQMQGLTKKINENLKQKEQTELENEINSETMKQQQEADNEYQNHVKKQNSTESALQQKRRMVAAQLEEVSARYKSVTDEITDIKRQAEDDSVNEVREEIMYIEPFPDVSSDNQASLILPRGNMAILRASTSIASAHMDVANISSSINSKIADKKKTSKLDELKKQEKELDAKVGSLKKELDKLDQQIAQDKLNSQQQIGNIQLSAREKMDALVQKMSSAKQKLEENFSANAETGLNSVVNDFVEEQKKQFFKKYGLAAVFTGPAAGVLVAGLNVVIDQALDGFYDKVDARVKQTRKQLADLGDDLYNPDYYDKVNEIHQNLINDLKAMSLTINYSGLGIASKIFLYETLLTADTSPETEDYFVGSSPKKRDLKAPKAVPNANLPPLREVIYFDDTDFQNVKPYDEKRRDSEPIAREDFLNYGREIPAIWKQILKNRAFVEKDIDLKALLNEGCSRVAFFRGGFMPCKVKGSSVVVDVNADGEYVRGSGTVGLNDCPYLEMRGTKVYNTIQDQNITFSSASEKGASRNCTFSELGTLLDADKNGTIFFRQEAYDAFRSAISTNKEIEKSKNKKYKAPKLTHAYDDAVLNTNQLGDYLRYVENEQSLRRQKEEVKQDYDATIDSLREQLLDFGYVLPENFDIMKDYDSIRSRLDNIKQNKINTALELLEDVDVKDNEPVTENVNRYKAILSALQKDKDELMQIQTSVVDENNIDEALKSAKVDKDVSNKYEKHLEEQASELGKISATPYCAIY